MSEVVDKLKQDAKKLASDVQEGVSEVSSKVADATRKLDIGRIVRVVLHEGPFTDQIRPAIVTQLFGPDEKSAINVQVFKGQPNDYLDTLMATGPDGKVTPYYPPTSLRLSIMYDVTKKPGTWHWPND